MKVFSAFSVRIYPGMFVSIVKIAICMCVCSKTVAESRPFTDVSKTLRQLNVIPRYDAVLNAHCHLLGSLFAH